MHDDHSAFCTRQIIRCHLVDASDLGVFIFIWEALFLDASHVDYIRLRNGGGHVFTFGHVGAMPLQITNDFSRHRQALGRHERQLSTESY